MTAPEHAAQLRARGFALCKPDPAEKKPTYHRWGTFSREKDDFAPGDMIGILCGPLSNGGKPGHALVIIDLDTSEANARADDYLPVTAMMEGRASKPRSHRYYLVPVETIPAWATSPAEQGAAAAIEKTKHAGPFSKSFADRESGKEVFRFQGTGAQAVCPPSLWVSEDGTRKEIREWEGEIPGEPAVVPFLKLWQACCGLASACGAKIPAEPPRPPQGQFRPAATPILDRARKYLDKMDGAVSGCGGHNKTFTAARAMVWGFDLGAELGYELLRDYYNPRCEPQWSERELRHKAEDADRTPCDKPRGWLRDAERHGRHDPGLLSPAGGKKADTSSNTSDTVNPEFNDTDVANGRRFACDNTEWVRYVADWGQWVIYDGRRWQVDRSETQVEQLAKLTVDRMAEEAFRRFTEASTEDKAEVSKARKALEWAKKSQDMRTIRRMLQAARSEAAICIRRGGEVFDTRRDLLNCPNGTIELRTGTLREHRREDYITRLCPTNYNPNAPRPSYLAFLSSVFDGKPAVAEYVRDLGGYVLTGEVSDQTLNIFNGDGSNGKNVLVDNWKAVLGEGEYAHTAAAELLVGDGWERHPTEKTGLRGARLVVCSETSEEGQLDETKMKSLTGGDTVTARYMRQDFFQFEPTHKLVLLTNNKPRVRGTDHGVWRRLRLVPFAVKFWKDADKELDPAGEYPDQFKADPTLSERLRTNEAEGILGDMVARAAKFYRNGGALNPPAEVTRATVDYRKDQDVIGQFFAARVRDDEAGRVRASELYAAFKRWWDEEGYAANKVPGPRKFGTEAKRKFHQTKASGKVYAVRMLPSTDGDYGRIEAEMGISARAPV